MKKLVFIIFPLLFLVGCSNYVSRYFYNCELSDNSTVPFAKVIAPTKVLRLNDEVFARYEHFFEDDFIKLYIDCAPYEIGFYIVNKTDNPIRIIWDSVKVFSEYLKDNSPSFIHLNKTQNSILIPDITAADYNEKVLLAELRTEDSLSVIKPSIILGKKTWMDEIQLTMNKYLLPYQLSNKESLYSQSNKVVGSKVNLLLPLKSNYGIKYYNIIFTVKDFQILLKD